MRVLLVTPDFPPQQGGIQLVMHRLAANLRSEVRVVTRGSRRDHDPALALDVRRSGRTGGDDNRLPNALLNLRAMAEGLRYRPDAVICGHMAAAPAARALRAITRSPVAVYVHAEEIRVRPRLLKEAVRGADAVIAVSRHAAATAEQAGAPRDRVHVVPPGVDPAAPPGESRRDRPTVVTVSRLDEDYKGHDVMLRALPLVKARIPEVEWIVIGDGRLRADLERSARDAKLQETVRFLGRVDVEERDRWYARSHVFAMPSRSPAGAGGEGFGIAYLEAASHGLPVVAGSVGGALDAVADGETGLLVDPTDHEAVAGALVALLTDERRAREMGSTGERRARQFTWQRHATAVERILHALVR